MFFVLSSKLPEFKELSLEDVQKIHDAFKEAGAYKEAQGVMGVYTRYVTEENAKFVEKMTGVTIA